MVFHLTSFQCLFKYFLVTEESGGVAPCPTGHRQGAVAAAGGLEIAKPLAATATRGEKTKVLLFLTGWWSIIPSASRLCPTPSCRPVCLWASGLLPVSYSAQKPDSQSLAQLGCCQAHRGLPGEVEGVAPPQHAVRALIPSL